MTKKLSGKIVCVTGASSGIGKACAERLAEAGASLILTARRLERLEALAVDLDERFGAACYLMQLDVSDQQAVAQAFSQLPEAFKHIDILVNNAGLAAGLDAITEANVDDWNQMIDTNIKGLMYVTKQVLPGMLARKIGHVVNIGSTAGHQVYVGGSVYCASKHAVKALSRAMKLECQGTQVRVTEVDPGMVETEFSAVRFKGDAERAAKLYASFTPLNPEDIADAVVYAVTRPAHVNIAEVTITATEQAVQLV
jgi:NADP-dependent 3-hydroxy acid dehydrogenase YdfG